MHVHGIPQRLQAVHQPLSRIRNNRQISNRTVPCLARIFTNPHPFQRTCYTEDAGTGGFATTYIRILDRGLTSQINSKESRSPTRSTVVTKRRTTSTISIPHINTTTHKTRNPRVEKTQITSHHTQYFIKYSNSHPSSYSINHPCSHDYPHTPFHFNEGKKEKPPIPSQPILYKPRCLEHATLRFFPNPPQKKSRTHVNVNVDVDK
ncbi:hypothetical protein CC78DRAFT_384546 [Lojkania enalia]|uniref:Uncharacterized protein n=1 Tax=Lojkania enalia TaxID=147567 RepID=A0A9P4K3V9_9PLEO|nr:hypothetical protein CC78DRAFT_384546 [Didymosphaeria enalia]